jgi:acyl-coenzyme A thioesterase PaaI-like protein
LVLRIQDIEMSLAAMGARRKAIEQQMARTRVELEHTQQNDEITRELQRILQTNEQLLSSLRTHFEAGRVPEGDTIKAQEGVAKARIELARRREELAKATGGGQLGAFGNELSAMAIDTAESHVRLQMLEQRLAETEAQIKEVSTFDPKATRVRTAREAMEVAERRVIELQRRIANLEPPIVTVIGASSL